MPKMSLETVMSELDTFEEGVTERKRQAYMRRAVAELQKVHGFSERDAASVMITVTSVVSLGPKSAK